MRSRLRLIAGMLLIGVGLALGIFVESPLLKHLMDDPRSAMPDADRGLVVRDNCHGTICYVTKDNAAREQRLVFLGPITVLLVGGGILFLRRSEAHA